MAFLVAGTLQVAAQLADARDCVGRKGTYDLQGSRVALTLSGPEASAIVTAALDHVFQVLSFENREKRGVSGQGFLEELVRFRTHLDDHRGPVGCALVALLTPSGHLGQSQVLVWELSRCEALQGHPKIFLLLSSGPEAAWEPGVFLTGLGEICGQSPHWSLLHLLTEPEPGPSAQYDLSGTRAALLLAVIQDRSGAQCDVAALGHLCQTLGFKVTLRTDPTGQAFREELAQFRERLDAHVGLVSCALVALMAHGGPQGQLLGADGLEVQPGELVQELSHCQALGGRPKIFLLQACRGGRLEQADFLTVYAAAEGCVAYRDEKGSDFVQTLVDVLSDHPGRDLLELLTEVNRRVCELDVLGPGCDQLSKGCLEIRSSLRRRLCLQD